MYNKFWYLLIVLFSYSFIFFISLRAAPAPTRILSDKITLDRLQGHWKGKYTATLIPVEWIVHGDSLTELYGPGIYSTEIFKIYHASFNVRSLSTLSEPTLQIWEFEPDYFNYREGIIQGKYTIYEYRVLDGILKKVKLMVFKFEMRRL